MAVAAWRARAPEVRLNWVVGIGALASLVASTRLGPRGLVVTGLLGIWLLVRAMQTTPRDEASRSVRRGTGMSRQDALRVLGLVEGANAQAVTAAHRSLIKKLHPDHGGSDFLAQQVNEAKKVLLG